MYTIAIYLVTLVIFGLYECLYLRILSIFETCNTTCACMVHYLCLFGILPMNGTITVLEWYISCVCVVQMTNFIWSISVEGSPVNCEECSLPRTLYYIYCTYVHMYVQTLACVCDSTVNFFAI